MPMCLFREGDTRTALRSAGLAGSLQRDSGSRFAIRCEQTGRCFGGARKAQDAGRSSGIDREGEHDQPIAVLPIVQFVAQARGRRSRADQPYQEHVLALQGLRAAPLAGWRSEREVKFILVHAAARQRALDAVRTAPEGMVVEIKPQTRSLPQNARMHAMFGDVAKQMTYRGEELLLEDWKRLLVDALWRATKDDPDLAQEWEGLAPRTVPSLDGSGVVSLGAQTHRFSKKLSSACIDYMHAWGSENDVEWSDGNQA